MRTTFKPKGPKGPKGPQGPNDEGPLPRTTDQIIGQENVELLPSGVFPKKHQLSFERMHTPKNRAVKENSENRTMLNKLQKIKNLSTNAQRPTTKVRVVFVIPAIPHGVRAGTTLSSKASLPGDFVDLSFRGESARRTDAIQ